MLAWVLVGRLFGFPMSSMITSFEVRRARRFVKVGIQVKFFKTVIKRSVRRIVNAQVRRGEEVIAPPTKGRYNARNLWLTSPG
jgi:hypothetical protein